MGQPRLAQPIRGLFHIVFERQGLEALAIEARREEVKHISEVRGLIIWVSDQLRCGEISLFEFDQEEAEAAKARLEAKKAKRRERYAKNKDWINVRRRETYILKKEFR